MEYYLKIRKGRPNYCERFLVQGDVMYRRGLSTPLLRCIYSDETQRILEHAHKGSCSDHVGGKFYWK